MKRILILVLVVVLLGGGGWWFLGPPEDPNAPKPPPDTPYYVKMSPLVVPVIANDQIVSHLAVEFQLELYNDLQAPKVKEVMPQLIDGYLRSLQVIAFRRGDNGAKFDIVALKERMLIVSKATVGPDVIRNILIQRAFEHQL
ncbi:MAG: hypothetical protein EXQ89_05010 [Rhodospirillaceae bacterium]|nr:hypothetical protein [Rhodospirillaceae bacterium]